MLSPSRMGYRDAAITPARYLMSGQAVGAPSCAKLACPGVGT
jgi:hypothetical protein